MNHDRPGNGVLCVLTLRVTPQQRVTPGKDGDLFLLALLHQLLHERYVVFFRVTDEEIVGRLGRACSDVVEVTSLVIVRILYIIFSRHRHGRV